MKLIVAVDSNWAIGYKGNMLFRLPIDLQHFKDTTLGHAVVMGKKTLLSLPGGRPLKNRANIVLTRDKNFSMDNVITANSLSVLLPIVKELEASGKEVFVIGGETIYSQLLDYTSEAIVTHIDEEASLVDTFFPDLSVSKDWKKISQTEEISDNGILISYVYYKNINVKSF